MAAQKPQMSDEQLARLHRRLGCEVVIGLTVIILILIGWILFAPSSARSFFIEPVQTFVGTYPEPEEPKWLQRQRERDEKLKEEIRRNRISMEEIFGGVTIRGERDRLREENERLREENKRLQELARQLNEENELLIKKNELLIKEIERLRSKSGGID